MEEAALGAGRVGADELASWRAGPQGLDAFGAVCAGEVLDLARRAEEDAARGLPAVDRYDPWGGRSDALRTSEAWVALKGCAAGHGAVADGHDPERGPRRRVLQFLKCVLFSGASAMASCPVAMTDGAATVLRGFAARGDEHCAAILSRLTAREPSQAWTSGQWMTENGGGTDVSRATRTVAEPLEGGGSDGGGFATHRLSGVKYFSSATDAEVALALAREGPGPGAPVSMFLVRLGPGTIPNHVRVRRLKRKLGTRALPTAELELRGCPARRLGEQGRGVREIAGMVNCTRLHNAASAASHARLSWQLCEDYGRRRLVQGRPLSELPLAAEVLGWMRAMVAGCVALTLDGAALLGLAESRDAGAAADDAAQLLRLLTPAVKFLTAKVSCEVCQEGMEFFGGAGYVEDVGVSRILRDALVLPIWEGASNVMALDVLRVLATPAGRVALAAALEEARAAARRTAGSCPELAAAASETLGRAAALERLAAETAGASAPGAERAGRALAAGLLLAGGGRVAPAARLWCSAAPPGALSARL